LFSAPFETFVVVKIFVQKTTASRFFNKENNWTADFKYARSFTSRNQAARFYHDHFVHKARIVLKFDTKNIEDVILCLPTTIPMNTAGTMG